MTGSLGPEREQLNEVMLFKESLWNRSHGPGAGLVVMRMEASDSGTDTMVKALGTTRVSGPLQALSAPGLVLLGYSGMSMAVMSFNLLGSYGEVVHFVRAFRRSRAASVTQQRSERDLIASLAASGW